MYVCKTEPSDTQLFQLQWAPAPYILQLLPKAKLWFKKLKPIGKHSEDSHKVNKCLLKSLTKFSNSNLILCPADTFYMQV